MIAILLSAAVIFFCTWLMGPAPPRELTIATGEPEAMYAHLGETYKARLEKMGIEVKLIHTQGSVENLRLLLQGKVDVAFVQAGTYELVKDEDPDELIRGLSAIQLEPLWIFYRGPHVKNLAELRQRAIQRKRTGNSFRVCIGQEHSGTAAVANAVLKENGYDKSNAEFLHLPMTDAAKGLKDGTIDAAFFVSSARNEIVRDLIRLARTDVAVNDRIFLLDFRRQLAYSQRFPYLSSVTLGEGVLDLQQNLPDAEKKMLATSTMLVCRDDLHPHAVEQILIAAEHVHARAGLLPTNYKFPTLDGLDVPAHTAAKAHEKTGQSFLTRTLPYWGVWLLFKVQLVIIPLLLVWLPLFRFLPFVLKFRINMLLRKHYKVLRKIEDDIQDTEDPAVIQQKIEELDSLRQDLERHSRKVPTHLQINVYQWRLHVSHVRAEARERLWHFKNESPKHEVKQQAEGQAVPDDAQASAQLDL